MLTPMRTRWASIAIGSDSAVRIFSVMRATEGASRTVRRITVNSSPPMRATVSESRTLAESLSATCISSVSPAGWPRLSLISLKPSRSRYSSASRVPSRRAAATARSSRSKNSMRFGSPVSASWWARNSSRARSLRCSVMSLTTP